MRAERSMSKLKYHFFREAFITLLWFSGIITFTIFRVYVSVNMVVFLFVHLFIVSFLHVNSHESQLPCQSCLWLFFSGPRTIPGRDGYTENICCINNCNPHP